MGDPLRTRHDLLALHAVVDSGAEYMLCDIPVKSPAPAGRVDNVLCLKPWKAVTVDNISNRQYCLL